MERSCCNCTHKINVMRINRCDRPGIKVPRAIIAERSRPGPGYVGVVCGEMAKFFEPKR